MAYKNFSNLSHKIVQLKNSPNLQYQSHHSYLPCSYLFFNTPMWDLLSFSPSMHYVHMYIMKVSMYLKLWGKHPPNAPTVFSHSWSAWIQHCTSACIDPLMNMNPRPVFTSAKWARKDMVLLKSCLISSHPTHRGKGLTTFICHLTATPNYRICVLPPPPPGGGRSGNETTVKAPGHRKWCDCTYPSRQHSFRRGWIEPNTRQLQTLWAPPALSWGDRQMKVV